MLKKLGGLFTTAYLLLIFGVYPFYMKQGYVDIGKAKYQFFIYNSLAALGIFAVIGGISAFQNIYNKRKRHEPYLIDWERISATDLFVMMYATEVFLSYTLSDYRKEALWGTEGWYMGLVMQLTLCALYFFISRFWDRKAVVWYVGVIASGVVFILGILDRFSIYLIPLAVREASFISTLGNINWFCGYFSVVAPIGICGFLFQTQESIPDEGNAFRNRWKKWGAGLYVVIAFMAGICQGSDSIFLFFGALFYILLWISLKNRVWLTDFFLLIFLWGISAQAVRLLRWLLPENYNYETNNLCGYLTESNISLIVGGAALGVYFVFRHKQVTDWLGKREQKIIYRIMVGVPVCGILIWLAAVLFHFQDSFLVWNKNWGNGRGTTILSGLQMYREMPVVHKLFGVGPDCFSVYAYSLPEVAEQLRDVFGNNRLTNAHNELLTCLINQGLLGVLSFVGIFLPYIRKCMKKGERNPIFYIFAVSIVCYFLHNMVSFAQVLNIPFLFLLLGMGEALNRVDKF